MLTNEVCGLIDCGLSLPHLTKGAGYFIGLSTTVRFINVISKVIISKFFISIVTVSNVWTVYVVCVCVEWFFIRNLLTGECNV